MLRLSHLGLTAAVATAAAALIPAAPAVGAWSNPLPVSSVNGDASSPSLGLTTNGKALIAYREAGGALFLNTRDPFGEIGTRKAINNMPAGAPSLATNGTGASAMVWQESDGVASRLHLRTRSAAGAFGSNATISPAGVDVFSPAVGIDGAGNVIAVWGANVGGVNRIFMRVKSAGGAYGSVVPVSATTGNFQDPRLAVESGGRAYIAYRNFESGGQTILGRARSTTGTLGTTVALSGVPGPTAAPAVSLDSSGKALVSWAKSVGGDLRAQARTRSASGTLSSITTLSSAGASVTNVQNTIGRANGTGEVAWVRGGRVQARRLVGTSWQAIENVSPTGLQIIEVRVGTSSDAARTTFLFTSLEGGGVFQRLLARERAANGTYGAVSLVSAANDLPAQSPQLAVNASGQAAAAWRQQQDDERGDLIWVGTNFL